MKQKCRNVDCSFNVHWWCEHFDKPLSRYCDLYRAKGVFLKGRKT